MGPCVRHVLIPTLAFVLAACGGDGGEGQLGATAIAPRDCSGAMASSDFYQPPAVLPAGLPGTLLRCQPISTALTPLARTTLVMYLSTDVAGAPIAVTGVVLEPHAPWRGAGPRPLVGYTDGTYGQGDQCSSSRLMASIVHYAPPLDAMVAYESVFITDLLLDGIAVVVTDYHQFGTPGDHTFLNRVEAAHTNIDAVRAARRLPGTGIPARGPVGFAGYSQGGHAAAATAELLPSYAPELDVVGIYAGAAPSDLAELMEFNDGGAFMGVVGYYLNGLVAAYPELENPVDAALNAAGRQLRIRTAQQCIPETTVTYGFQRTSALTLDGRPLSDLLRGPALHPRVAADGLGGIAPEVPVLLAIGASDDVVPVAGTRRLADDWCARGALVEYFELPGPSLPVSTAASHIALAPLIYAARTRGWLRDRFNGLAPTSTCGVR